MPYTSENAHVSGQCAPRVLVVDDEPLVARMVQRALEGAYHVAVEHTARASVDRFARGERWDVVVADLHLPDGDAIWVRNALARIDSTLPARLLILTGGASTAEGRAFLREPSVRWLQKPFRADELLARVGEVLAISRPPAART
jgi:DNA-binding response OmpR family regulator